MCKAPNQLADGTLIACRECSLCRERAINDWVGRNIAESKTASASFAVTLTYGRNSANDVDHERAVILTYSDFQKYIKLLRRHGHDVRYHVTGEYGSKKGRAHWHAMLYFYGSVPEHVLDQNFMEAHWPHGWSFWTRPSFHAVRYNCKYIMKGQGEDERQGHMAMTKKPPLGTAYFRQVAEQHVRQGLAPQTLEYRFADVRRRKKDGTEEVIPFRLKGRPAELYLDHFIEQWREVHGDKPRPKSDLVDLYEEWGRIIFDEDKATERSVDHITTRKMLEPIRPPAKDRWKPMNDVRSWWANFVRRVGLGTEEQQRQTDREFLGQYTTAYHACEQAGCDLRNYPRPDDEAAVFGIWRQWVEEYPEPERGSVEPEQGGVVQYSGRGDLGWTEFEGWDYDLDRPTGWKAGEPIGWPPA